MLVILFLCQYAVTCCGTHGQTGELGEGERWRDRPPGSDTDYCTVSLHPAHLNISKQLALGSSHSGIP